MPAYDDGSTPTLVTEKPPAVMTSCAVRMRAGCAGGGKGALVQEGVSGTLATGNDQTIFQPDTGGYVVRRLTPVECERLQGFPDGWTDVPDFDGKPMSDAQRYKQLGNSMAVPVMRWIGKRILMVDEGGTNEHH